MIDSNIQAKLTKYIVKLLEEECIHHGELLEFMERTMFEAVMKYTKGNQVQAARVLGMARITLRKKLINYFGTTLVGKILYTDETKEKSQGLHGINKAVGNYENLKVVFHINDESKIKLKKS